MKKILVCFFSLLLVFCLAGCGKSTIANADSLELGVASELTEIDGFDDFNQETQKALAVAVRTKLKNNQTLTKKKTQTSPSKQALNAASLTKGELLNIPQETAKNISYSKNVNLDWSKTISKFEVLSMLKKHNINLSNISKFEPNYDEYKKIKSISIGGKEIDYQIIADEFDLKSNEITNINSSLTSITISGKLPKNNGYFDITEAQSLAQKGQNYKQLLNHFYSNYDNKTTSKTEC